MKELSVEMLEEVTCRIVDAIHPQKIVLFGSYVWGEPTENSDIDLMVIVDHLDQPGYRLATEVYRSLRGMRVPVEVVVRSQDDIARGLTVKTSLERKVLEMGRVLHG